jgi:phenylalanyl-tRNA synthetase beta chain
MKISRNWLQTFFEKELPDAQTLADALTFHAFEIDGISRYGLTDPIDEILDVKVTPNRGHDCLSHWGIARELSAILKLPLHHKDPFATYYFEDGTDTGNELRVRIETSLCRRYIAAHIRGVKVGPSPDDIRQKLESIGQRSINNVVDATNFVMFNIGQPLHAFDARKLTSLKIGVREARANERMHALDGKEYELHEPMMVITAGDETVGIAGVKGGLPTAIDEHTTDIVLEAATFDGPSVRKTAAALKLRTDASSRFEQVLSPKLAQAGLIHAANIIRQLAGGELVEMVDVYPNPAEASDVSVSVDQVNAVLGTDFPEEDIAAACTRLGFSYETEGGVFTVTPPVERLDLTIAEDLVEEVGRIIGYDRVPSVELPALPEKPAVHAYFALSERIREFLLSRGFSEVYTSVFTEEGERAVLNKVDSVRPFLRRDLLAGLRGALERNVRNKELLGVPQVRLFEIGTRWKGGEESRVLALAVEKLKKKENAADVLRAFGEEFGVDVSGVSEQEEVLELPLEELAANADVLDGYAQLPASEAERYAPFSRYPFIVRDVAMWTPKGTSAEDVAALIKDSAGELAVRIDLFDRFEKEEKVSYAFRIVFQSFDKTLTDEEANQRMESVYAGLREKGYEIR